MKALRFLSEIEQEKNLEDNGIHTPEGWRRDLKYVSKESGFYCIPLGSFV
jgi:hypothetical protein